MVLVSMVAYRDGWENWAASCLGEYTEKDMQSVKVLHTVIQNDNIFCCHRQRSECIYCVTV